MTLVKNLGADRELHHCLLTTLMSCNNVPSFLKRNESLHQSFIASGDASSCSSFTKEQ